MRLRLRLGSSRTGTVPQTPVGAGRTTVTVIPERRGDTDFIALFLAGVALLVAWRSHQPVVSVISVAVAAVILGGWIWQRMKPAFALTIGPDEIVYGRPKGRPNERRTVIARGATDGVLIEYDGSNGGWFLVASDGDDPAGGTWLPLIGFRPGPIANACEAHGWPVTVNPPINR
jgi:hypothetical protein